MLSWTSLLRNSLPRTVSHGLSFIPKNQVVQQTILDSTFSMIPRAASTCTCLPGQLHGLRAFCARRLPYATLCALDVPDTVVPYATAPFFAGLVGGSIDTASIWALYWCAASMAAPTSGPTRRRPARPAASCVQSIWSYTLRKG